MRAARLAAALDAGIWTLPETGDIAVVGPHAGDDISALPRDRVVVVTGNRPDHDHFAGLGYRVATGQPPAAATLVCLPRARAAARARLAEATGTVAVDGQKDDGIDSLYRELRGRGAVSPALAKAHGKVFTFAGDLSDWQPVPQVVDGFQTVPGVFSADGPDPASVLLAAALPDRMPATVADLGAGWGFLARAILSRAGVATLHLVEAELAALTCARTNVTDPRAVFHWADATRWRPPAPLGAVVMNPPFHSGRAADPSLGVAFLHAAHASLAPEGSLWMVANRHLPYDAPLGTLFHEVADLGGTAAFRLTQARRPRRKP
jgi:16S rRNA (guanine1207-N2)-methyltransferase